MAPFDFKLENHFVGSFDGTSLQVYELTKSSAHFSSIYKADWKKVATINPQQDDDVDDVDGGHACDGLRFFEERIEEPEMLTMLAQHLNQLRLLANPKGYCFQKVSEFGVHYLRLNDLFSWPRYGVKLVTVNTTWSRVELKLLKDEDDHELDMKTELQNSTNSSHINVLIVLVGQLKRQVKKKEERIQEVEKLNDDLEEANETKDEELHKLQRESKRKDSQLEMLKRKLDAEEEASDTRIAELEKQKDKELQKLERQLKKKSQRIEELEKMNEELEEAKDVDEVSKLKKLLKVKDKELQVLRKKKEDDEAEASKLKNEVVKQRKEKDDEVSKTVKVEEKLRSSVAEVAELKKELEECQRKSWAILPSTKFLPQSLDAKDKYRTRRHPVPSELFKCKSGVSFPFVSNSWKLVDKMQVDNSYNVRLVDEESSSPGEWPPLPTIFIWVGRGDEDFDKTNWWYLKTTHPEGGLTMLVYYQGNRSQISHTDDGGDPMIPLPFSKDILEVYTSFHKFTLFRMEPFGVRYGFAYRPK